MAKMTRSSARKGLVAALLVLVSCAIASPAFADGHFGRSPRDGGAVAGSPGHRWGGGPPRIDRDGGARGFDHFRDGGRAWGGRHDAFPRWQPGPTWRGHFGGHFRGHGWSAWRGGHWMHGWHGGTLGWWWVVGSLWYLYPFPIYPYPAPWDPADMALAQPEPVPTPNTWYYCRSSATYYPYVKSCPEGWQTVPATPPETQP